MSQTYIAGALVWLALGGLVGAALRPFINHIAGGRNQ